MLVTYGGERIDPCAHSFSALCFSSGQCFGFFNEMQNCVVNLANLMFAIVGIAIFIALIVLL
jgi:hypothetical protein